MKFKHEYGMINQLIKNIKVKNKNKIYSLMRYGILHCPETF